MKLFLSIHQRENKKKREEERKVNLTIKSNVFCFERWTKSEDDKLRKLKKQENLGWKDIEKHFPERNLSSCQNRWSRHLNREHVSFIQILFFFHLVLINILLENSFFFKSIEKKTQSYSTNWITYLQRLCTFNQV